MSDKKRTVTTIETHEVWIIRRAMPGIGDEVETATPHDVAQPAAISPLNEQDDGSETQLKVLPTFKQTTRRSV